MSKFFPAGLKLDDSQTPMQILEEAMRDWEVESAGLLALVLQLAKSQSGNDLILVHGKHVPSNRTISLFSVVHRPGNPYPATIQLRQDDLPKVLRKSFYEEGLGKALGIMSTVQGRTVNNPWVSDTPSEFRSKLQEAFNSGLIKSEVLNLVAGTPEAVEAAKAVEAVEAVEDPADLQKPQDDVE